MNSSTPFNSHVPKESVSSAQPNHERPLVLRIAAMGDAVLLVPMLKALRRRYGQACDVVSAGPWIPPVLRASPDVAAIHLLASRRMPYLFDATQREFVRWLRTRRAGPVYVCENDKKIHWLLKRGGISGDWLCSLRDIPPLGENEHQIDLEMRLAARTPAALGGVPLPELPAEDHALVPSLDAQRDCEAWLASRGLTGRTLILIQPGNKRTMRRGSPRRRTNFKYWPEDRWTHVARRLRQLRPDASILVCGSPLEQPLVAAIVEACADPAVIDVTHDLPVPRLMALQTRAHSMVSIDTGPAHLASAVGCPLVVLFSHADSWRYFTRPTTAPVEIVTPPANAPRTDPHHPLLDLPAETVVERWRELEARVRQETHSVQHA